MLNMEENDSRDENLNIVETAATEVTEKKSKKVSANTENDTKTVGAKSEIKFCAESKKTLGDNTELKEEKVTETSEDSNAENKEEFVPKLMSNEEKETFFAKLREDFKQKLDKVNKPLLDRLEEMKSAAGEIT